MPDVGLNAVEFTYVSGEHFRVVRSAVGGLLCHRWDDNARKFVLMGPGDDMTVVEIGCRLFGYDWKPAKGNAGAE